MHHEQTDPQQEMNVRVVQHRRQGWTLLWRQDEPPLARMRKVENPEGTPLGMFVRPASRRQRIVYRDITIGANGCAVWHDVPRDLVEPRTEA